MTEMVHRYVIPAAYSLLPPEFASDRATALLLAIGLQESRFAARQQLGGGPARGFWQFEVGGLRGVLTHERTQTVMAGALRLLQYDSLLTPEQLQQTLAHNDVLAACCARCLLWTSPHALPERDDPEGAWRLYVNLWRPGRPKQKTWAVNYQEAWTRASSVPVI